MNDQSLISLGAPLVGGGLLGLAAGYALKKIMKLAFIALGCVALFLGYLEYQRMITVNWMVVENQTQFLMTHLAHKAYVVTKQMGTEIPIGIGLVGFMPGLAAGLLRG